MILFSYRQTRLLLFNQTVNKKFHLFQLLYSRCANIHPYSLIFCLFYIVSLVGMPDETMAVTLLRTTLAYCLQFILGIVLLLHNQLKFGLIGGLKDVCSCYLSDNSKIRNKNSQLKVETVPRHIAVVFVEQSLIDYNCITDMISHSLDAGLECITFYDPWSILHNDQQRLQKFIRTWSITNNSGNCVGIIPWQARTSQSLQKIVPILGSGDSSRNYRSPKARLNLEPDLLVKLGADHWSLAGYPAFSLRVTELVGVRRFQSSGCIKKVNSMQFFNNSMDVIAGSAGSNEWTRVLWG
uniref:ditrans,polycis-polyprenyl diphosphate synthase [(2E,6E)-farnesyldiphosphate specific] n=1 Tax=Ditylenchus dipsaci TaxID=166011 RepID=A0A915DQU0_9BILA